MVDRPIKIPNLFDSSKVHFLGLGLLQCKTKNYNKIKYLIKYLSSSVI